MLKETEAEYKRIKSDFLKIAKDRRRRSELLRSDSLRSPSPSYHQSSRRSKNLPKFKIANFYPTDVELWFNQIETQLDLHDITDDDERYQLTCAALSGEVASDVRDVLLQPFCIQDYLNLKEVLIERRYLTMSERVNRVILREKLGVDIPSRFLRRLQKTSGFGASAVVGKAVIHPTFIRQMPTSIGAYLATQPYSTSLESLANLADRALVSESDGKETNVGVSEINVKESTKIIGVIEDISERLEHLETSGAKKKHFNNKPSAASRYHRTFVKSPDFSDVNAKPFIPNASKNQASRQGVFSVKQKVAHPIAPPPDRQQNNALQLIHTDNS